MFDEVWKGICDYNVVIKKLVKEYDVKIEELKI